MPFDLESMGPGIGQLEEEEKKQTHKGLYKLQFHLYRVEKYAKLLHGEKIRTVVSSRGWVGLTTHPLEEGHRGIWGVMKGSSS